MNVVVCGENRRADWDDLIAQCADATSGHLWNWRDVVGSAYGFDPHYLLAQDGRGRPIAAAPFIFVRSLLYGSELSSMPYLDYGGVCHADSLDSASRNESQAGLIAYARGLASKLRVPTRLIWGTSDRLLPSGTLLPKHVPSFASWWNGQLVDRADLAQEERIASAMMRRRGWAFSDVHSQLTRHLHDQTAVHRRRTLMQAEQRLMRRSA